MGKNARHTGHTRNSAASKAIDQIRMVCSRAAAGTDVIRSLRPHPLEDAAEAEQRAAKPFNFAALCHFRPVSSRLYNVLRASWERHRPLLGGRPEEIKTRRTWGWFVASCWGR